MRLSDSTGQTVLRFRNGDQMNVVGHEAVCPYLHAILSCPFGQQSQVRNVICVGEKGLLSAIAPLSDTVGISLVQPLLRSSRWYYLHVQD